jgi:hypothetical protein
VDWRLLSVSFLRVLREKFFEEDKFDGEIFEEFGGEKINGEILEREGEKQIFERNKFEEKNRIFLEEKI